MALAGHGGTARIVMHGAGPALRLVGHHEGTAVPASVKAEVWQHERFSTVSGPGDLGQHPEADGIELIGTMQPVIDKVLLRACGTAWCCGSGTAM